MSATDDGSVALLQWSVQSNPTTGAVSFVGGNTGGSVTICYQPNINQTASDSFVIAVTDQLGGIDTIPVNVTVTNQPPVIGGPTTLGVNLNSTCPGAGNQVAFTATDDGPTASLQWSIQTNGATGTASFVGGNTGAGVTVCYQASSNQCAADSFTVKVQDTQTASNTKTVNVTVNNANPAISGGSSLNVVQNSTCPAAANQVALSATDDGNPALLNWSISQNGAHGDASFVGGQSGSGVTVCYTPNASQSAADSFIVRATDPCGGFGSKTINVTVQDNPPQITTADPVSISPGLNSFCGFVENEFDIAATDEDASSLTWTIDVPPAHGNAQIVEMTPPAPPPNTGPAVHICYEPDPDQANPDSFVVKVTDSANHTDTITANVTVVNLPPTITNDGGTGQMNLVVAHDTLCPNGSNQITVLASDSDAPSSALSWSVPTLPATGTLSPSLTGTGSSFTICYKPNPAQTAPDSFVIRVADCCNGIDTVTVLVTVTP